MDEDIINPISNFIKKYCLVDTEENNLKNIDEDINKLKIVPDEIQAYIDENKNK